MIVPFWIPTAFRRGYLTARELTIKGKEGVIFVAFLA